MCDGVSEAVLIAGVAASAASAAKSSSDAGAVADAQQADLDRQTGLSKTEFDKRLELARASDARVGELQRDQYDAQDGVARSKYAADDTISQQSTKALLDNSKSASDDVLGYQKLGFDASAAADRTALDRSYGALKTDFATRDAALKEGDDATARAWSNLGDTRALLDTEHGQETDYRAAIDAARTKTDAQTGAAYDKRTQAAAGYRALVAGENDRQDAIRDRADATVGGLVSGLGQPAFEADRGQAQGARDRLVADVTSGATRPQALDRPGQSSLLTAELDRQLAAGLARAKVASQAKSAADSYGDALAAGNRRIADTGGTIGVLDQEAKTSAAALGSELNAKSLEYRDAGADASAAINNAARTIDINRTAELSARQSADTELAIRDAALKRGLDAAQVLTQIRVGNIDAQTADILKEVQAQHDATANSSGQLYNALATSRQNYGSALDSGIKTYFTQQGQDQGNYYSGLYNLNTNYYGGMESAEGTYTQGLTGDSNNYENTARQLTDYQINNTRPSNSWLGTALSVAGQAGINYGLSGIKNQANTDYIGATTIKPISLKYQSVPQ